MANKSFDFGKVKRSFYTAKLKDGKVLVVNMPEKRVFEKMQTIQEFEEDEVKSGAAYEAMLELVAEILSNNKNRERITAQYLSEEKYDIEELVEFIQDYAGFVNQLKKNPN